MKIKISKSALLVVAAAIACSFFLTLASCDGGGGGQDPEPELTAGEQIVANLVNTNWKVQSVTIDGVDKSSMFTNFSITFSPATTNQGKPSFNGSYNASNGGPVWQNGNWQIPDQTASAFTRSDNVVVKLDEVSSSTLKMSLNWSKTTFGSGRTSSVKGQHVFVMTK